MGRPFCDGDGCAGAQFNASIRFDVRLYDEDISGSIAWAKGLAAAGVLTAAGAGARSSPGWKRCAEEFGAGTFCY